MPCPAVALDHIYQLAWKLSSGKSEIILDVCRRCRRHKAIRANNLGSDYFVQVKNYSLYLRDALLV